MALNVGLLRRLRLPGESARATGPRPIRADGTLICSHLQKGEAMDVRDRAAGLPDAGRRARRNGADGDGARSTYRRCRRRRAALLQGSRILRSMVTGID